MYTKKTNFTRLFKTLDHEDRLNLESIMVEEEVWKAIQDCGSQKAPGLDGFNFGFIKKCWPIIKIDLMKAIEYFWCTGNISNGCISSFITLIPINKDASKLEEFRPISLIGCYYKIISKILANRIKKVMNKIIGESQNAFLGGRYILDGVLVTNEAIEFIKKKK